MLGCYLTCPSKIPTLHTFLKEIAVALPKDFTNQSYNNYYYYYYYYGGGWMICHFSIILIHFVFLLIEFHCTFSISYEMLRYFDYYYYILIRM